MSRTEPGLEPPLGEISNFDDPPDVLRSVNIAMQITCMVLVTPLVLLRTWIRVKRQRLFNSEDWGCLGAWVGFMAYCIFTLLLSLDGGGINQWNVTKYHLKRFHHTAFGGSLVYGPAAFLCKVTLLRISTRVFQPLRVWVILINTFMALMFAYYLTVLIIKIRICTPISGFWDTSVKASCLDVFKVFIGDTFVSVLTDIAILLVPIPLIWSLHLPVRQKIKIFAMLGAGGIATAQSVARLVMVLKIGADPDETVSIIRFSILGSAELTIGLICATLPALNALLTQCASSRTKTQANEIAVPPREDERRIIKNTRIEWIYTENDGTGPQSEKDGFDMRGRISGVAGPNSGYVEVKGTDGRESRWGSVIGQVGIEGIVRVSTIGLAR